MPTTVNLSVGSGETKNLTFNCGSTFVPDDIQFVITGSGGDTNTDYVIQCDTAASTRLKSGTSVTSYTPTVGIHLIHIKNANSLNSSLYGQFNGVPSSTTSVIYINGSASSSTNRTLPAGLYAAYYDGTRWHFRTDGKIDFGSTGFLKADGGVDTNTYLTAVSSVSAAPAASLSGTTLTFKQLSQTTAAQVSWTDSTTTLTFNTAPSASNNIATMTDVNNAFQVNDAMVYKGTIGTGGTVTTLPSTHHQGWTYKVITAGTYAGQACEIGDMIICITDGTSANNSHWTIVQSNIDGAVIGPSSSTANNIVIFDGTTGKLIKDSGYTIGTSVPSNAVFTDEKVTPVALTTTGTTDYNILLANNSGTPTTNGKPNYATTAKINGKGEITASKIITNSSSTDMLLANGNTLPQSTFATSGHDHSGYLTSHQTIKVDGVTGATTNHYGTCGTAANTATKEVTVTGTPTLEAGLRVIVKFTTSNTAANPTLKVGATTAKTIYYRGSAITSSNNNILQANRVYEFVYDGTYWQLIGDIDTDTQNAGTVTSVGLSNATNGGLTISGSPITSSGSITVGHTNVLSSVQSTQAVYPITIDRNGHISSYGTSVTIPTISGTNDGTNWTAITINGTTKNIPSNSGSGTIIVSGSNNSTTPQDVSQSTNLLYLNYVQNGVVNGSVGIQGINGASVTSVTISGSNQQLIRIIGSGSGSGGGASYLTDLNDVYVGSSRLDEFLGYNGSTWTAISVAKTVNAGSGLNTTSGDTTNDGGYIGFGTDGESDASVPTGTLHLTRVNNASQYNGAAKIGFGPTANKIVTSSNNTFNVPYYQVDKFGRVTGSITRTITINGLGGSGSGGGSSVSVGAGESTNLGYKAGKVTVDNVDTNFIVPPARSVLGGGSQYYYTYTSQGLVRPRIEYDMTYYDYRESSSNELSLGTSKNTDLENLSIFYDAPDPSAGKPIVLLPIVTVYYMNDFNGRMESAPFLALDYNIASDLGLLNGYNEYFSPIRKK